MCALCRLGLRKWRTRFLAWDTRCPMSADLKQIAQTAIGVDDTTTSRDVTSDLAKFGFRFMGATIPPCSPRYSQIHSLVCCRSFRLSSRSQFTSFLTRGWQIILVIQRRAFKRPQRDTTLISLAGPVSNLLLATMLAIVLRTIGMAMPTFLISTLIFTIFMNITLAIFNLIPIHPLDGGKILIGILPPETGKDLDLFLHRYGFIILIFLIFPFGNSQSPVSYLIRPIISGIANFLLPM